MRQEYLFHQSCQDATTNAVTVWTPRLTDPDITASASIHAQTP